jgi:beta-galactosidase
MQQMVALRKQYDPYGMRVMGARGNGDDAANKATTPIAEFYGVMIGQDPKTDAEVAKSGMFRAYSPERRDRAPIIETEDYRDEGARRYWDEYSPPYFGFKKGPNDTYEYNSDTFALGGVKRYWEYFANRISNTDAMHSKWSGYASIYFTDENADGRQDSSEVARVSGKLDAVRLPKEIYYAFRVIQNDRQDLHILGHWSYPVEKKVVKTIYVISNVESVELFVNGKSLGVNKKREDGYVFAFPKVEFVPGSIKAVGSIQGQAVVQHELKTAGPAVALKLTPIVGPGGLQADGADVVLIDVEAVDANGMRVPTDDARVDFTCSGPGVWRGGYNSGKVDSTNNLWLNTELGINRVAVRSGFAPGTITVTAKREGLKSAEVSVVSKAVVVKDGLSGVMPGRLAV